MSTFRGKEAALGKEGEQEVEEIMWVPSLILFLTQSLLWALSHIVSHLVSHVAAPSFKPDHTFDCVCIRTAMEVPSPFLIPAPILFLAQSLWDVGKFKERFVAYGPSPA